MPQPEVAEEWLWAWRAWWRLHADRPWHGGGFGAPMPGRIPWQAVRDWCAFQGLPGDAVSLLDAICAALDEQFSEHYRARLPK